MRIRFSDIPMDQPGCYLDHGINVLLSDGIVDMIHHDGNRYTFLIAVSAKIMGYGTDLDIF